MQVNKIKGVIFDLDGTLANTLHVSIASFKMSLEPLLGRSISSNEIIDTFGPTEEGTIMSLAPEHYEKGISDYLLNYEKLHHICPRVFEGIIELLDYLKNRNVRLAIVTGKGNASTQISIQALKISSYFDIVETGSPYHSIKEKSLDKVIRMWEGIDKKSIVYIGDTVVDIEASNNVGIDIISAAWSDLADKNLLLKFNPYKVYDSVSDFFDWIKSKV